MASKSKNSMIAKGGYRAEVIICESPKILEIVFKYVKKHYNKNVIQIIKTKGNKKSDISIICDDGTIYPAQVKSKTINSTKTKSQKDMNRGWSFNRCALSKLPFIEELKNLVDIVCLKAKGTREEVIITKEVLKEMLEKLLLGYDKDTEPIFILYAECGVKAQSAFKTEQSGAKYVNIKDNEITKLSICKTSIFIDKLVEAFDKINPKKTCVYLTPDIYLQRKGAAKTDRSPNDIQVKLRKIPDCMEEIYAKSVIPETIP